MATRFLTRVRVVAAAALAFPRRRPAGAPRRVLVAHHPKMIGDTILMSPILAKARHLWPAAQIVVTSSPATQPLYAGRPWGVEAIAFDPYDARSFEAFGRGGGFDLAIVPGDNRYGWFARAAGARWVVGFAGDRPPYKDLLVDEHHPYPGVPGTWGDMAAAELIAGPEPPPYAPSQWPAPPFRAFDRPARPYAVIHLGASTPLKLWAPERWSAVAAHLEARGLEVVWSAGRGEEPLVARCDPQARRRSYAGALDLAQMWHLIAGARLFVTPDTGVAHVARLSFTPTVTLFGPGSSVIAGNGRFFRDAPWSAVAVEPFHCRDQPLIYKRHVAWVRQCKRTTRECASPACMHAIEVSSVIAAIGALRQELA